MGSEERSTVTWDDNSFSVRIWTTSFYAAFSVLMAWIFATGLVRTILLAAIGLGAIIYLFVGPPHVICFDGLEIKQREGWRTLTIGIGDISEIEASRGLYRYDVLIRDDDTCIVIPLDASTEELRHAIGEALRGKPVLVFADGRVRDALLAD